MKCHNSLTFVVGLNAHFSRHCERVIEMKPISIFLVFSFAFVSAYADYIDSNYVTDDTQFNTDSLGGCKPSLTTTSGLLGEFNDTLCSGQLIFVENFDRLDKNRWKAEVTLGGGGVSI